MINEPTEIGSSRRMERDEQGNRTESIDVYIGVVDGTLYTKRLTFCNGKCTYFGPEQPPGRTKPFDAPEIEFFNPGADEPIIQYWDEED